MGTNFRPAVIAEVNKQIAAAQKYYRSKRPVPLGFIGGGYAEALALLSKTLEDPDLFGKRHKPTILSLHGPYSCEIESTGTGLLPSWVEFSQGWNSDDLIWSFNLARQQINSCTEADERLSFGLSKLDTLALLWPFSRYFEYTLSTQDKTFAGTAKDGLIGSPGGWSSRTTSCDFSCCFHMEPAWFPNERLSEKSLAEQIKIKRVRAVIKR